MRVLPSDSRIRADGTSETHFEMLYKKRCGKRGRSVKKGVPCFCLQIGYDLPAASENLHVSTQGSG